MEKKQLIDQIIDTIKTSGVIKNDVTLTKDTSLFKECFLNSIDIIELIVHLEKRFGFEFNDTDLLLDKFETVSSIASLVLNRFLIPRNQD